jgi:uncharacterized membrane protein YfcA
LPVSHLAVVVVGLIAGFILASAGIIGPFLVPTLLFLGLSSGVARGTTLLSELPITLVSVLLHREKKHLDKAVTLALLPGAFFVVLGANLSNQLSESWMKMAIGILEVIIGVIVIRKTLKLTDGQASETAMMTKAAFAKFATAGIIAGLIKGFFGLGWGPISVGLLLVMGIDPQRAVGSSLVVRLLLDCLGGITYVSMNLVDFTVVIALTVAGVTAVPFAIKWTTAVRRRTLSTFLGCVIIVFGALVILGEFAPLLGR